MLSGGMDDLERWMFTMDENDMSRGLEGDIRTGQFL
jgi:hypothetical protein